MKRVGWFILIVVVLAWFVLSFSMYTVSEGEQAVILKLGELVKVSGTNRAQVVKPGLHFKTPFITRVRKYDVRLRTLNVDASKILTAEQKYVLVDYYTKWQISDLPKYYRATGGNAEYADQLLTQKINDALRAAFGKRTISEVVSSQRGDIMSFLKHRADQGAEGLGIDVNDVRIKAIDLPETIEESVFKRMSTQREQVATKLRSEGKAQAETIQATADRQVAIELAKAKLQAQEIRASGDKQAAAIYNAAYDKNKTFYAMYRSLQSYQQVFGHKTVMVLKPTGKYFKYFGQ